MLKSLLLLAIVANVFLIVSCTGTNKRSEGSDCSSSSSSSSNSHSSNQNSHSSNSSFEQCGNGKRSESSENSSHSSSSSSSTSNSSTSSNSSRNSSQNCGNGKGSESSENSSHSSSSSSSTSNSSTCSNSSSDSSQKCDTCGENESYVDCPDLQCRPQTCSQLGFPISCPAAPADGSCPGEPGCVCNDGYVRNDKGVCIPSSECPSCGGDENAQSGCGVNCNNHCSEVGAEPGACMEICHFNACDCKKGYVLDDNTGKCVLPNQCTPTCGEHEVFSNCTNGACSPQSCSQLGYPIPCPDLAPDACEPGCVCEEGYLRADDGSCIPINECPSCGGDPNAESGCGINCGRLCSNYNSGPVVCPLVCKVNGCDCKKDYVFDTNLNKCVLPRDCSPTCGEHEVFSNCTNGGCSPQNCSQLGYPVPCVDLAEGACTPGCVCEDGYLRADDGTCIPINECPSCGGDPNAQSGCGINCGRLCSNYDKGPVACPRICKLNGCDCKKDYVFDSNLQKCVLPCDCTPVCEDNEEYSSCANQVCRLQNCSQYGQPIPFCPRIVQSKCKSGCICKNKYLRNAKGHCIPQDQCPEANSGGHCGDNGNNGDDNDSDEHDLLVGNTDFTLAFLNEIIKKNPGKSVVMSPFSVLIPMAELALFTDPGSSLDQLMNLLNLENKDQIRSVFPQLITSLNSQQEATVELVAKSYFSQNFELTDNFIEETKKVFEAEAETVDFSDAQKAADSINAWVAEVTRNLIPSIVTPNMLSAQTRLVLVNAIYFLGNWVKQFNVNDTKTDDFHITSQQTVQVPMMYVHDSFNYTESKDLNCQIVEVPYKGGNFSYVVFVPNEVDGYTSIAKKILNYDSLNKALDLLQTERCNLHLPRHEITSNINLAEILQSQNVTDAFNVETSDFHGILKNDESLEVSSAIQKAIIKVDETGTEAAAVNVIVVGTTSVQFPQTVYTIKCDRPFIYLLMFNNNGVRNPLFCGVYAGN